MNLVCMYKVMYNVQSLNVCHNETVSHSDYVITVMTGQNCSNCMLGSEQLQSLDIRIMKIH